MINIIPRIRNTDTQETNTMAMRIHVQEPMMRGERGPDENNVHAMIISNNLEVSVIMARIEFRPREDNFMR